MSKIDPPPNAVLYAQMAAEYSRDGLLVTDRDDTILWANRGFEKLTGYSLSEMLGRTPAEILRSDQSNTDVLNRLDNSIAQRRAIDIEVQYTRKDGKPFWMESHITPIFNDKGEHTHFMSSSRDVSKRRTLERASKEASENERMRQQERRLLSQISEWLYSAKSLEELLQVVSRALETLIPEAEGQLFIYAKGREELELQTSWGEDYGPDAIGPDDCWALRRGRAYTFGMRPIEFPCAHAEEEHGPYFCIPIMAHGQTNGLLHLKFGPYNPSAEARAAYKPFLDQRWELALLCAEQISLAIANVQLRQELLDQSIRDPLTNLWNRRWFVEAAQKQTQLAERQNGSFSIICFDVDHFKKFNDEYGHDAGDLVLTAMGSALTAHFTGSCNPCRMGGEEFTVLCPDHDVETAAALADEFRDRLTRLKLTQKGTSLPPITVSAGVATWPDNGRSIADLLQAGDEALYDAKAAGRDRVLIAPLAQG